MITATVRYKLPLHIDYAACREHFQRLVQTARHRPHRYSFRVVLDGGCP